MGILFIVNKMLLITNIFTLDNKYKYITSYKQLFYIYCQEYKLYI